MLEDLQVTKCGHTSAENRRIQALFRYLQCNHSQKADEVGAINVLRVGHAQLACGETSV